MKSIYLLLSAVLVATTIVWAWATAQGVEKALVSIGGVECCLKVLRARTRVLPNTISSVWPDKTLHGGFVDKISEK